MKTPRGEIIRGEVSIFRGGAGGLSYFSKGSRPCGFQVGAGWAEELDRVSGRPRHIETVSETVERLILMMWCRISSESLSLFVIATSCLVESYLWIRSSK